MAKPRPSTHDHASCVGHALATADALCAKAGWRLTPLRKRVLELIWASHRPVGAYALLAALGRERGRVAPPTVYRALKSATAHGLVHRIASANAFVGCDRPQATHASQFLLCADCGDAVELADAEIGRAVAVGARRRGYSIESQVVEVVGRCAQCTDAGGPHGR